MPDYDVEAVRYDATRGGLPRARAAAQALSRLLGPALAAPADGDAAPSGQPGVVLDCAAGTGIVTAALAEVLSRPGRDVSVVGLDLSAGMLGLARDRMPGRIVRADAGRLPVRDGVVRAVTCVWFLQLLDDAEPVVAEAARVLAPGGRLVTTVDKQAAQGRRPVGRRATDSSDVLRALAGAHGLTEVESTTFVGVGQGRDGAPDPSYRVVAYVRSLPGAVRVG